MTTNRQKADVRARLMLGGALIAFMASPAFAQTADRPSPETTGLSEVIVTATKVQTNLQRTPIAISVIGSADMESRHVDSLVNLSDGAVPSLRVATFESRQSALTVGIRGIVPFDANQTARDQGVGVYIDGVYLGRQQGLNSALFDVERIEILRGPQGTLFGRNTEGGALSIVTKAPTGEFGGRMSAGFGNFGAYNTEFHVDLPAAANLAVKVDGLIQHQDAFTKNPLEGEAGWGAYHRYGGRISAQWKPVDGFSADVSFDISRDENTPYYSQLLTYNAQGKTVRTVAQMLVSPSIPAGFIAPLPAMVKVQTSRQRVADIGVPQQPSVNDNGGLSATLKYDVSPALQLRSITAVRAVGANQWDNSGGAHRTPFSPNGRFSRYSLSDLYQRQFSQEFQAVGDFAETVNYVAGFYYFKEHVKESAASPSTTQWNADGTAYTILSSNVRGAGWQRPARTLVRASFADADSYAVFGQATWTPASMEALHLTVGARYTNDKRNGTLYVVQGKATNFLFDYDDSRIDPLVTLAYDATPDVNVYAKYSTGFRAGGANSRSQTFAAFKPEDVKAYEVGSKMYLLDHRVRLNVAAYMMNRENTQTDFDNVDTNSLSPTFNLHTEETRNANGVSKIKGLEAELTVKPTDSITFGASYAYTDIKIPNTPNPFLGNVLTPVFVVYTPKNSASGYIDYAIPVGDLTVNLHLDANYADAQYSFQSESVKTDSSFIMNGNVALTDFAVADSGTRANLSFWIRNLLDETHIYRRSEANAGTLGDYGNLNPPRTFGVELTVKY